MTFTILDESGEVLTEITSRLGRSSGHLIVDWATRPDVLFQHYFDRGSRAVTVVIDAAKWSATLGTRWHMGARSWFLHEFVRIDGPVSASRQRHFTRDSGNSPDDTAAALASKRPEALAATPPAQVVPS
jgi:hypothetical protein